MDLIENPELRKTYDKCKYVVKYWEYKFKKKSGRQPSKLDIKEAPRDVRHAYKTYFDLKSVALENSFKDIDAFNFDEEEPANDPPPGVNEPAEKENVDTNTSNEYNPNTEKTWGSHLSIVNTPKEEPKVETGLKVLTSFTKKLYSSSKLSKRNPRKSLSFAHIKKTENDSSMVGSTSLSQPAYLVENSESSLSFCGENVKTKILKGAEEVQTSCLNIAQTLMGGNEKMFKNSVDLGWIERVSASAGTNLSSLSQPTNFSYCSSNPVEKVATRTDYSSDDVVDNSEEESEDYRHASKRRKVLSQPSLKTDFKNILSETSDVVIIKEVPKKPPSTVDVRKSSRRSKQRVDLNSSVESEEEKDPYATDGSSDESFKIDENEGTKKEEAVRKGSLKRKAQNGGKKKSNHKSEEDVETYELEYSVKPRIKTVPRLQNIADTLKFGVLEQQLQTDAVNKPKTKREQEKQRFEKKLESGNLNENYVRINLKKKIYTRGKKTMNFSKFKKQEWRARKKALAGPDMDMGGCDGTPMLCFKCGEAGHFARFCSAHKKGDQLLPADAEDASLSYPTLEEAAEMMRDRALVVRKPKNDLLNNDGDNGEQEEMDSDDELLLSETIKMEEIIARMDVKQYTDKHVAVKPYYDVNADGSVIETPSKVYEALRLFGHSSFRPGQETAIMRILSGKSTLVTLSTGSGKSLIYQLPAYLYSTREPCLSLVISPLVSLMEDQLMDIPHFLKAATLHTNQTKTQREKIRQIVLEGKISVLLVSPESVVAGEKSNGFGSFLRKLPPIAFACIDEAHCLSQWSHNFRPSYLMICHILRERLGVNTILGLTATATRATCDSIVDHLRIPDGVAGIISDQPIPDNLRLTVSMDVNRDGALLKLLSSDAFKELKSIIVYCSRRDECERVASFLRTSIRMTPTVDVNNAKKRKRVDVQAEPYHAGMSAARRKAVQKAFMSGELKIVVATVAFGMGINKSDIRCVIHYNMPSNFESYVQEVGRAGRDGLPARCHLFLESRGTDENQLRRHIYATSVERHVIRKLLQKIFVPCSCKHACPRHEVAFSVQDTVQTLDVTEEIIATLLCYLELHPNRYVEVLSPAYTLCKVVSYSGSMQIRKSAKDCPLLTMALAMYKSDSNGEENILEFPVVELAAAIGWDSGICKHKLKNLEWTVVNGQSKRSTLNVQFKNLGFRVLAPGNLTDSQLDEALDSLYEHVVSQERTSMKQLCVLSRALKAAAEVSHAQCMKEEVSEKETELKARIREYFSDPAALEEAPDPEMKTVNEERVATDAKTLIAMYRDVTFTGKAIARIFFGIQSPNYPALVWGRCKFWRAHLGQDFHAICRIATKEILQSRCV